MQCTLIGWLLSFSCFACVTATVCSPVPLSLPAPVVLLQIGVFVCGHLASCLVQLPVWLGWCSFEVGVVSLLVGLRLVWLGGKGLGLTQLGVEMHAMLCHS